MNEALVFGSVGVLSIVGVALTCFGFELAKPLLRFAGLIAGAVVGAGVGVFLLPAAGFASISQQLPFAVVAVVFGAAFGSTQLPALGRVAATVVGFVVTAGATLVVLTGERVIGVGIATLSDSRLLSEPGVVLDSAATDPAVQTATFQHVSLIAVAVGLVGSALAFRYYTDIISVAVTGAGATILGIAIPLWIVVLQDGASAATGAATVSPPWVVLAFAAGLAIQLYRHFEALDPRSGDALVSSA